MLQETQFNPMKFFAFVFVLGLLVLPAGCERKAPLNAQSLVGSYGVKYSHGSELLTLAADGSFTQTYTNAGTGVLLSNSGRWEYKNNRRTVYLSNALLFDTRWNQKQDPPRRTNWLLDCYDDSVETRLSINEEIGLEFLKNKIEGGDGSVLTFDTRI